MLEGHHISHNSSSKKKVMYIDDPLRLGEKIAVTDICPSCGSLHVTKTQCESCGLQFGLDVIGEPFGPRSFFTLKDDFDALIKSIDILHFRFRPGHYVRKPEVQRYLRHLLKRYNDLIHFLTDYDLDHDRLFLYETKEIMNEYARYVGDLSALYIPLKDLGEDEATAKELKTNLYSLEQNKRATQERGPRVLSMNWTLLKQGIFMEALAVIGALVLASFLVMKFLIS